MYTGPKIFHVLKRLGNTDLDQWFSTWESRPAEGSWSFLDGTQVDILCTQLYYICFIRVLDGVVGLKRIAIMGRATKKVENHRFRLMMVAVVTEKPTAGVGNLLLVTGQMSSVQLFGGPEF